MDGDEMEEFTDEQLSELDRIVENLPQNDSPIRNTNVCKGIALKRGRTSSFEGFTDEQLAAIDNEVESANKRISPKKTRLIESPSAPQEEDLAGFNELTATQLSSLDQEVERFTLRQQHTDANANVQLLAAHANTITASQIELAAAIFDDEDDQNGPPNDHAITASQIELAAALFDDEDNQNEPPIDRAIAASQIELAAALFDDEDNGNGPSLDHLECLRSHFKHYRFREKQWEIIRAVMIEKRDVCAVMATGYGKSLCFQVLFQRIEP